MRKIIKSLRAKPNDGQIIPQRDRFTTDFVRESAGTYVPVSDQIIVETALKILANKLAAGPLLNSPTAVKNYLRLRFADLQYEIFSLLYLDKRHRLIACEELFRGTIDGASVHPREVVKNALRHNCAVVICCHNHPLCFVESVRRRRGGYSRGHFVRSRRASSMTFAKLREGFQRPPLSRNFDEASSTVLDAPVGAPAS